MHTLHTLRAWCVVCVVCVCVRALQGPTAFSMLLGILSNPQREHTTGVLLGAVFIVGMSVWGAQRVTTITTSFTTVLHAMACACHSGLPDVACEVGAGRVNLGLIWAFMSMVTTFILFVVLHQRIVLPMFLW